MFDATTKRSRIKTVFLGAFLAIQLALPARGQEPDKNLECLPSAKLVDYSLQELGKVTACDALGRAYLIGLGIPVFPLSGVSSDEKVFDYYYSTRVYLALMRRPSNDALSDIYGHLIAMLSNVEMADPVRKEIYTSFAIWQYMEVNETEISMSKDSLYAAARSPFVDGTVSDLLDLGCFVLADLPSLELSEVKRSRAYLSCKERDVEKWLK
jgi:hypothetical protein